MNKHMVSDFFATWWQRQGSRLIVANKTAPGLEDYVMAAFMAGYKKRDDMQETIKRLTNEGATTDKI